MLAPASRHDSQTLDSFYGDPIGLRSACPRRHLGLAETVDPDEALGVVPAAITVDPYNEDLRRRAMDAAAGHRCAGKTIVDGPSDNADAARGASSSWPFLTGLCNGAKGCQSRR
jgi:hypothetical protein